MGLKEVEEIWQGIESLIFCYNACNDVGLVTANV